MSHPRVPRAVRERITRDARNRCGYCLSSGIYTGLILHLDHLVPRSLGGLPEESNLRLACADCNVCRSDCTVAFDPTTEAVVRLFNPRLDRWSDHFAWAFAGQEIEGLTPTGRATVIAVQLNRKQLVHARIHWIHAGWRPPKD